MCHCHEPDEFIHKSVPQQHECEVCGGEEKRCLRVEQKHHGYKDLAPCPGSTELRKRGCTWLGVCHFLFSLQHSPGCVLCGTEIFQLQYHISVDCIWSEFKYTNCSNPCGAGMVNGTRSILVPAQHGGKNCTGPSTVTTQCNTDPGGGENMFIMPANCNTSLGWHCFLFKICPPAKWPQGRQPKQQHKKNRKRYQPNLAFSWQG